MKRSASIVTAVAFISCYLGSAFGAASEVKITHYAFKEKHAADATFSGIDLQYKIDDQAHIAGADVACIVRADRTVSKKITVHFFIYDAKDPFAFLVSRSASDPLPISDSADTDCTTGSPPIADPNRVPARMRMKVINRDSGEYTEVDLDMVGPIHGRPHDKK
jgi:hypothetical protein